MRDVTKIQPKMAIETTRELFNTLLIHGASETQLLEKSGINFRELQESDSRYPVASHLGLWKAGESLLNLNAIGLQMGAKSDPFNRGVVGLAFTASKNLQQAVDNKVRYTKILADHISLEFERNADEFSITYSIMEGYFNSYEIERVFSGFLNWIRVFVNQKVCPIRLDFQYAEPKHSDAYKKHFQCSIFFDQAKNTITLPAKILTHHNKSSNDYLYQLIIDHAESVLNKVGEKVSFVDEISSIIASRLCQRTFSAEDVALALKISKRTLNRKLGVEEMNYQSLLNKIRKEMAISYLEQGECSQQTIPYLLGYSDSRSFLRAFKRWTGTSPKQYLN